MAMSQKTTQLELEIVPRLIRALGAPKAEHVSEADVCRWLDSNRRRFDRSVLHSMVQEADFKHDDYLDSRSLMAAISGASVHDIFIDTPVTDS
jgi:hypothetical protein